uniref:Peptidase S51 dipeptidase E n=1 Tax=Caulobacter sp. (strain K31) TaxID=366602 RepID=B0SX90_CAUSK
MALRWMSAVAMAATMIMPVMARAADAPAAGPDATGPGYEYYAIGDVKAPTPGKTGPLLALMGGGDWPLEAFRQFVQQSGGGHIVVLRARGGRELQDEIYNDVGGVLSVETLVIHDEDAGEDPKLLAIIAHADGVFFGGGDQSNYVRAWKGTALNKALDAHVKAGKPIGGTSAGLAILGGYVYGCLDSISLTSPDALKNPTGPSVTLVRDFLHLPYLSHVITDTHFDIRDRQGRLVTFVGRLAQEENDPTITGLGVDQDTAMLVDANGIGRFYGKGYAWLVRPMAKPATIVAGRPLNYAAFPMVGIGPDSTLDFKTFQVTKPAFTLTARVKDGVLIRSDRK